MTRFSYFFSVIFFALFTLTAHTQVSGIHFKTGTFIPTESDLRLEHNFQTEELVNGDYFRLIQFEKIPTPAEKSELKQAGFELLSYLPRNAFFVAIASNATFSSLTKFDPTCVVSIQTSFKLSQLLHQKTYPHWTLFGENEIELNAIYYETISSEVAHNMLTKAGATILHSNSANTVTLRVSLDQLETLYALPAFYYFEELETPEEPENIDARTNHRSNLLATEYDGGLKYDGTGVNMMMQDDGYIGDHIDYEGRNDQSQCFGCSTNDNDNHGDHVAGTIMGAGNLNPRHKGMAYGADLMVFSSTNSNYDLVPNLYTNNEVVITSKSYSSGCNGGYDSRARQLDQQIYDMPSLMHVFSAGNAGTSDCGYGAGAGWGNITGGHKSAKNVIAVGNLTDTDIINNSSSRGPATDGRIKPDVCGVGTSVTSTVSDYTYATFTGTSMSCPGVAGSIAQLYHAYRDDNMGVDPNSALIKAAILNTAEDLGNVGPDFIYGWGRINVRKAHDLIVNDRYLSASISQGGTNTHQITVPTGKSKLKIMVYWADFEAVTNASIALVNDLNLQVVDPAMVAYQPWVLNSTANVSALNSPATTGVDNLNNMEQVEINAPLSGTYTITINGFAVPEGPQEYFIVYEFEDDEIVLTYPNGGEGLNPNDLERIRWDASEGTQGFTLEYTTNNGASWTTFSTPSANSRSANWFIPNTLSGQVKVRITRGASTDESDDVFSIIPTPENLDIAWACSNTLKLTWDSVPGATGYEVSKLGQKYMDSIGFSNVNNLTVSASSTGEHWFSVRALGPNEARSERAIAIQKVPGEFGCVWGTPYAQIQINCDSISEQECVQIFNSSINTDSTSSFQWYFPTGSPSTSTDENPVICFNTPGYHDAALVVTNNQGSDSVYFGSAVFAQAKEQLPFFEGFENMSNFSSQSFWSVNNFDNNSTFSVTTAASLSGNKSARLLNISQQSGDIDELVSGPIDLSTVNSSTGSVTLSFRYAYRQFTSASDDWLRLLINTGCDEPWVIRKTLHGATFSNLTASTSWTPADSNDWVTVHVTNITSSYFSNNFRFKFQFENGEGNNFYLDNINLYEGAPSEGIVSGLEEITSLNNLNVYPNPATETVHVAFAISSDRAVSIRIRDLAGKTVQHSFVQGVQGKNLVSLDVQNLATGSYFVEIESEQQVVTKSLVIQ